MNRKLILLVMIIASGWTADAQWKPAYVADSLCRGFQQATLDMGNDYNGKVVATLVRKLAPDTATRKAVLYIHGFNDYFFQTGMADQYIAHGYNFYALDLRKNGRSILPGQVRGDVRDLVEYYNEIEEALNIIRATILQIAAQEGSSRPEKTRKSPDMSLYGESLHRNFKGEWNYSLSLKPLTAPDMTYGWIHAVNEGIRRVKAGLHIAKPVLVMHSDRSIHAKKWTDDLFNADAVLDVEDIHKYAANISTRVTIIGITGGMHDLVLSRKPVRDEVYRDLFGYLSQFEPR